MKKKLFLTVVMALALFFVLVFCVYATEVDYEETATLADGTALPIYDENGNSLIWYVSGVDSNGNNVYASVPNNRNEANENKDTFVTYTINKSWMTQLENINFHIWNSNTEEYEVLTEESIQVVVVNLRGLTDFEYINKGLKVSDIQYIYFNEILKDFCEYFKGSTAIRLVDLSVCTNLSGGFGGNRNLYNCTNLHTVRLASGTEYSLKCSVNNNWRFSGTAITEIVFPSNITSVGVDNFKNCKQLTSIYILGNTTSLGQRNFLGCDSLTNIYFLGNDPQIDITSISENFYECVDGNTTHDFSGIGKYFFFVCDNSEYLSQVKEAIGALAVISYSDYIAKPQAYTEGRYVIYGTNICDVYYGEHIIDEENANPCAGECTVCGDTVVNHTEYENISVTVEYASYLSTGSKITFCNNPGCTYKVVEETDALFRCLGYSASEDGHGGIAIGYTVNNEVIAEYTSITGKSLKYGVFAVLKDKLDGGDIFGENGATEGVVSAEILNCEFVAFEIKVTGFMDTQKDVLFAVGAYVEVTDKESTVYSYMQDGTPTAGEKYCFVSYNSVCADLK